MGRPLDLDRSDIAMFFRQEDSPMRRLVAVRLVDHSHFCKVISGQGRKDDLPIMAEPKLKDIARAAFTLAFAGRYIEEIPRDGDLICQSLHLHILRDWPPLVSQDRQFHLVGIDDFQAGKLARKFNIPGIDPAHIREELGQTPQPCLHLLPIPHVYLAPDLHPIGGDQAKPIQIDVARSIAAGSAIDNFGLEDRKYWHRR